MRALSLPFATQLRPIGQTLCNFALEAAFGRVVIGLAIHALRKVILAGKAVWLVMVIAIAGAIFLLLHKARGSIEDDLRRRQGPSFARTTRGGRKRRIDRIRFWRRRHVDDRLRESELAFRRPQ